MLFHELQFNLPAYPIGIYAGYMTLKISYIKANVNVVAGMHKMSLLIHVKMNNLVKHLRN